MTTKTYRELLAERNALDLQIVEAVHTEREAAITAIQDLMALYHIDVNALWKACGPSNVRPVPAKYRDPDSGKTWSGRGKPPRWIAGKNRAPFEV